MVQDHQSTFSELVKETFSLLYTRFSSLLKVACWIAAPLLVLHLVLGAVFGLPFIQGQRTEQTWTQLFLNQEAGNTFPSTQTPFIGLDLLLLLSYPLLWGAGLYYLTWQENEPVSEKQALRHALTSYFRMISSWIAYIFYMTIIGIGIVVIVLLSSLSGILIIEIIGIAAAVIFTLYISARICLFFGFSVIDGNFAGISRSWKFTRGFGWWITAYLAVFFVTMSLVDRTAAALLQTTLGSSVLQMIIQYLVYVLTSLVALTAYAVLFKEMKRRNFSKLGVDL
jgi:hypothetical protein